MVSSLTEQHFPVSDGATTSSATTPLTDLRSRISTRERAKGRIVSMPLNSSNQPSTLPAGTYALLLNRIDSLEKQHKADVAYLTTQLPEERSVNLKLQDKIDRIESSLVDLKVDIEQHELLKKKIDVLGERAKLLEETSESQLIIHPEAVDNPNEDEQTTRLAVIENRRSTYEKNCRDLDARFTNFQNDITKDKQDTKNHDEIKNQVQSIEEAISSILRTWNGGNLDNIEFRGKLELFAIYTCKHIEDFQKFSMIFEDKFDLSAGVEKQARLSQEILEKEWKDHKEDLERICEEYKIDMEELRKSFHDTQLKNSITLQKIEEDQDQIMGIIDKWKSELESQESSFQDKLQESLIILEDRAKSASNELEVIQDRFRDQVSLGRTSLRNDIKQFKEEIETELAQSTKEKKKFEQVLEKRLRTLEDELENSKDLLSQAKYGVEECRRYKDVMNIPEVEKGN